MKKYFRRGRILWDNTSGCSRISYLQRDKKATEERERAVYDNGCGPAGSVLLLEYRACGAIRKSETSRPITGRPENMEGLEYLLLEPACEVNEKGTSEKNDGNENVSMADTEK